MDIIQVLEEAVDIIKSQGFGKGVAQFDVDTVVLDFLNLVWVYDRTVLDHDLQFESGWIVFLRNEVFEDFEVDAAQEVKSLNVLEFGVSVGVVGLVDLIHA